MFSFEAGGTLQGIAGTASAITVTVSGVSVSAAGVEAPIGLLYQGQLPNAAGVLFTVPAGQSWIVKTINITNATGSSVAGVQLFQNGAAAANSLIGPITMSGHYTLTGSENGWAMTDAAGSLQTSGGGGGGGGTVTSVGLSLPAEFNVTGSPVTGSGTLTGAWVSQSANTFLAAPNGGTGVPSARLIVPPDLPVATTSAFGAVKPDGTSITIVAGVISAAPAFVRIAQVVLGSPAATIAFSAIPGTFTNLILKLNGQSVSATADDILFQFNGDTGSNYDWSFTLGGAIASYTSGATNATTAMHLANLASTSNTNRAGIATVQITGYANALFKACMAENSAFSPSGPTGMIPAFFAGNWRSTSAITSILLKTGSGSNFAAGTVATLYGEL